MIIDERGHHRNGRRREQHVVQAEQAVEPRTSRVLAAYLLEPFSLYN